MPSDSTISALLSNCGEFKASCQEPPPNNLTLPSSPLEATPLPFRRFLGGELKEGAFAFVWQDGSSVNFLGVMQDSDVFSNAAPENDRTWEKGDVFEVFIQPAGGKVYYEIHAAANGAKLELRISSIEDFRHSVKNHCSDYTARLFKSGAQIETKLLAGIGWAGFVSIPLKGAILDGSCSGSKFLVSRYNYNRPDGPKPELSAVVEISREVKSYHCPELWIPIS